MKESLIILVAEDNERDVLFLTRAFQKAAVSDVIHFVSDGQHAIEYLAGIGQYADRNFHPLPDLAFFDIEMPRKTGLEALQWLRRQPQFENLPVMLFTSSPDEKEMKRAYDLEALSYVPKPDSVEKMAEELKRFYAFCWPTARARKFTAGKGSSRS